MARTLQSAAARLVPALFLFAAAAWAQPAPHFLAADIHASSHSGIGGPARGPFFGDDRFEVHYAHMLDLIQMAYGVATESITGGPNWLELNRYDITALVPPHSTEGSRKLMLQALLADRFKLSVHTGTQPVPAFKLTAGKSPKLQESDGPDGGCDFKLDRPPQSGPPPGPGSPEMARPIQIPVISLLCKATTMAEFAQELAGVPTANQTFQNKPVFDQTGLTGHYDITLRFTPTLPAGLPTSGESMPLLEAIDKQLGLKLELGTAPMPAILVESASEPTPNSPGDIKAIPPAPTEFDAAELKPTQPGPRSQLFEIKNGRVLLPGMTVQNLVWLAYDIGPQDEIVNAPKWLRSDSYDLIAKAPEGVALGDLTRVAMNRGSIPLNLDALRLMLRSLVIEKFKLQAHMENRPQTAYTLVAVKPKMEKADPSRRASWTDQAPPGAKNPGPGARTITVHNMTMAEFAKALPEIAQGDVNDCVDATGLEGRWDFTINYTMSVFLGGGRGGDAPQAGPGGQQASDPTGGISFFDAVQKQLGLKLEQTKRPLPVLVIDHIEEKPVEN